MEPFERVEVLPSYMAGFTFRWTISSIFYDPLPWNFVVEEAPAKDGPWTAISTTIVNQVVWIDTRKTFINKDEVLFFRITLTTPNRTYVSQVKMPYGDLPEREFLLAREIMRKEVLRARTMSGIIGKVWNIATFGPICTHCEDPITHDVLDSNCVYCFGTGREPGYHGPYATWMTFSPADRDAKMSEDGSGNRQPYTFSVRTVVCPRIKESDVIIDPCTDKRYYVDRVKIEAEIRRVPIIQTLTAHEAPVTEPIYRLGLA